MSRTKWIMIVMLVLAVVVTACGAHRHAHAAQPATPAATVRRRAGRRATAARPRQSAGKKKIGFSVYDMQYGFFQDMEKGTKEAAQAAGYDYVLVDQKSSESTMVAATMDLLTQGIDALIISPVKPDAMGPIVDAAKKKNIPVVVDDIGGGGTNYDAIVISDNAKGGLQAADYLDSLIKAKAGAAKKVASITCDPTAVYAWQRNVNFEKRIKELGYTVVASLNGNSKQEEGYRLMKDVLSANPDVAGIFSCNDPMAVGAAQAIADAGKQPSKDIFVVGFNADEIALKAIKEGTMNTTIQQVPYEMGKMTVNLATQLMNGQALKYDNADLREIYVPVNLITAETSTRCSSPRPRPPRPPPWPRLSPPARRRSVSRSTTCSTASSRTWKRARRTLPRPPATTTSWSTRRAPNRPWWRPPWTCSPRASMR